MLSIHDPQHGISRREWLRVGGLGAASLSLPGLLQARSSRTPQRRPKSCIVLFFLGAPPQQETWDPKPDSPSEARGDLKCIASATPGLRVGELMPRTARLTERIAVLRAMYTNDNAHSSSGYYMTTGVPHQPRGVENVRPGAPNDSPALGAVVRKVLQQPACLPAAVTLPEQSENDGNITWPGQDAGFLGRANDPWLLKCDPSSPRFQVPGLSLPDEVPALRFDARKQLLRQVNTHLDDVQRSGILGDHHARTHQAFDLISSPSARKAFDLDSEPPAVRDRYGRTQFGQSTLLARRLVESGVSLVRVNWTRVPNTPNNGHWDTHSKNTEGLKALMPIMDQTYSALLEDLSDRGLLDDTLVVWAGEFGRTPKINGAGGRDHWGPVFSVALSGGGVRGGAVHGTSDSMAAYPKDGATRPEDLLATIYHLLGIPPETEIHDNQGRPLPVTRGEIIRGIL